MPSTAEALAAVTVELRALSERMDRDREDRLRQDKLAQENRHKVANDISALTISAEQTRREVLDVRDRLDAVEPVTDMVTSWKARMLGALFVLGLIGSAIIGALTFFKEKLLSLIGMN